MKTAPVANYSSITHQLISEYYLLLILFGREL